MSSWTCLLAAAAALLPLSAAHAKGIRLPASADRQFETLRLDSALSDLRAPATAAAQGEADAVLAAGHAHPLDVQTQEVASGIYRPLAENLSTLLETSYARGNGLTAEWSVLGQVGARFGDGWGVRAGVRHSEQELATSLLPPTLAPATADLGMLTFERQWNRYRGEYTYYAGRSDAGASASGHRIQLQYFYSPRSSVGLAYHTSRQLDAGGEFGAFNPASDVANVGVVGEHWFSPTWALNYNALVEDGGNQGLNPELRLGLRVRF
jgi:YaiO family outer membrane protein